MFTIINFAPEDAPARLWKDYYYFYKITSGNFPSLTDFKNGTRQSSKDKGTYFKLIYKDDILVCSVELRLKKGVNGGKIPLLSFVCGPAELPHGFDGTVAETILQFNEFYPSTNWQITSTSPVVQDIARQLGGEIRDVINYYELSRQDFDANALADWRTNALIKSGELTPALFEYIPEHLYGQFASFMTELMNDIVREYPTERFNETAEGLARKISLFKQTGVKMLTLLLFDRAQKLAGLSFVLHRPYSHVANQEMTGIARTWRGQKLAAWLKATLTTEAFQQFKSIDKIETNCYVVNKAIIHLNEQMDYREKEQRMQFEIHVDDLMQFAHEV